MDFNGFLIFALLAIFVCVLEALLKLLYNLVFAVKVVVIHVFDKPLSLIWVEPLVFDHDSHGCRGHVVIKERFQQSSHISFKDFFEPKHDQEIIMVAKWLAVDMIENVLD